MLMDSQKLTQTNTHLFVSLITVIPTFSLLFELPWVVFRLKLLQTTPTTSTLHNRGASTQPCTHLGPLLSPVQVERWCDDSATCCLIAYKQTEHLFPPEPYPVITAPVKIHTPFTFSAGDCLGTV